MGTNFLAAFFFLVEDDLVVELAVLDFVWVVLPSVFLAVVCDFAADVFCLAAVVDVVFFDDDADVVVFFAVEAVDFFVVEVTFFFVVVEPLVLDVADVDFFDAVAVLDEVLAVSSG